MDISGKIQGQKITIKKAGASPAFSTVNMKSITV